MNMEQKRYRDFADFLGAHFDGKVQKISLHAGFTCPNRDGSIGVGGCTYCNNQTFSPDYCHTGKSITCQIDEGIAFFARKYPDMRYLAYFQAYTNTYGELEALKRKYEEALDHPGVVGIIIGTRPDCMPDDLLAYLAELSHRTFVLVEYGVESTCDETLRRINRGHDFAASADAICRTSAAGVLVGAHLILGLPGETRAQMLDHARRMSQLPLDTLKLHQLQLIRHTRMAREYEERPQDFHLYAVDEYIDLAIDFAERLSPRIAIERFVSQSPASLLIAPNWGLKNHEFTARLLRRMRERDTWQGRLCEE